MRLSDIGLGWTTSYIWLPSWIQGQRYSFFNFNKAKFSNFELKCSDGWWDRFRKRNTELVLRKTQKMGRMRSGALNENVIGLLQEK